MSHHHHHPHQVTGFHSCDKIVGLKVLNGEDDLKPSNNPWDWLGNGVYFWEENPARALEYAIESARGTQFNKIRIKTPFVLGTTIQLGHCLNLIEPQSLQILSNAYIGLEILLKKAGEKMPVNKGNNRALDCAVIKFVHQSRKENNEIPFDTIRSAFSEGGEIYPGSSFSSRGHIEICVLNPGMIKGYYLPRPLERYNPCLKKDFDINEL